MLALWVAGCNGEPRAASLAPGATLAVYAPTDVCRSELEAMVAPRLELGSRLCADPSLRARYLRADVRGHDVVLVRITDVSPTETDGPVVERRVLLVDGARAPCESAPCEALDALGASVDAPDSQLVALLAIAVSFQAGDVLLDTAAVENRAALWPLHAETLRARPVGLVRRAQAATLDTWVADTIVGAAGDHRTLDRVSATLEDGAIRVARERVVSERGAHIKSTSRH